MCGKRMKVVGGGGLQVEAMEWRLRELPRHVHCYDQSCCDILQIRAMERGRRAEGQGAGGEVENTW